MSRLLALLLLAGVSLLWSGESQAGCVPFGGGNSADCDTSSEAYAWLAALQPLSKSSPGISQNCPSGSSYPSAIFLRSDGMSFTLNYNCNSMPTGMNSGLAYANTTFDVEDCTYNTTTRTCDSPLPTEAECLNRPDVVGQWATPDNPEQVVCSDGCIYGAYQDPITGQNFFSTFNSETDAWFGACAVGEYEEPLPDSDSDGVADANDAFPSNPNESADADGDGVGDNADTNDTDPDNGKDSGIGDETDNSASGSGSCAAPPQCSGDAIQCEILYTNWKISCSGATVSGSPEVCTAAYACSGDTAQCAQIALLRETACQGIVAGPAAGDADGNGVADVMEAAVSEVAGETPGVGSVDGGAMWSQVDQNGWLSGGTCPGLPPITINGTAHDFSAKLCEHGSILAGLFVMVAMAGGAFIIGKAATGA